MATGRELAALGGLDVTIRAISWSPDGRRLAVGGADYREPKGRVARTFIWDTQNFKKINELDGAAAFFCPDGRRIAVAGQYAITIHDAASGQVRVRWNHPKMTFWQLCWSPDGRFVAGKYQSEAHIWEAATGRLVATLAGHGGAIKSLDWSPDGERLATAGDDKTVRLWDAHTGMPVFTLRGHDAAVLAVAWSGDGLKLASAAANGTVRIWDAAAGSVIDRNPARFRALDEAVAANPADVAALRSRGDLLARLERWQDAALDYQNVAALQPAQAPIWFQSGWWAATALEGVAGAGAEGRQLLDPFLTERDTDGSPAALPSRPRWYCSSTDPNGYVPVSTYQPYLVTRVFSAAPREVAFIYGGGPAFRGWMNGQRLRDAVASQPVTVRKGWNTLVVTIDAQVGEGSVLSRPRSGFFARPSAGTVDLVAAYFDTNQPDRAVEIAMTALEAAPNDAAALSLAHRASVRRGELLRLAGKTEGARSEAVRSLALLDRLIAVRPAISSLAVERATRVVDDLADWTVLEPLSMKSAGGATLSRLPDRSILAGGKNPDHETYIVTTKTRLHAISGFRLEALQHPWLPGGGPGRLGQGGYLIGDVTVMAEVVGDANRIACPTGAFLRYSDLGWAAPALKRLGDGPELTLTFVLNQAYFPKANLGRFRLSATTYPDFDLLTAILARPPRTPPAILSAVAAMKLIGGDVQAARADLSRSIAESARVPVTDEFLSYLVHERLGGSALARSSLERGLDRTENEQPQEELLPIVLVKALSRALEPRRKTCGCSFCVPRLFSGWGGETAPSPTLNGRRSWTRATPNGLVGSLSFARAGSTIGTSTSTPRAGPSKPTSS